MRLRARCASICIVFLNWCPFLLAQDGAALYKRHCAACHDQVSPRIPLRSAIQKMSARRILRTMDFGLMMNIAYPLHREEREAIANFLGTGTDEAPYSPGAFCSEKDSSLSTKSSGSWTGWSPTFSNTRFQPAWTCLRQLSSVGVAPSCRTSSRMDC
jgi:polyvinyl alcohol dehydrogenase (cytochrome)